MPKCSGGSSGEVSEVPLHLLFCYALRKLVLICVIWALSRKLINIFLDTIVPLSVSPKIKAKYWWARIVGVGWWMNFLVVLHLWFLYGIQSISDSRQDRAREKILKGSRPGPSLYVPSRHLPGVTEEKYWKTLVRMGDPWDRS